MGLSSGRDFLSTNVAEAAAATPKYQDQEEVRGSLPADGGPSLTGQLHGHLLLLSSGSCPLNTCPPSPGLPPTRCNQVRYVFKPYFGELPPYLQQRKREQAEQREAAARAAQPQQVRITGQTQQQQQQRACQHVRRCSACVLHACMCALCVRCMMPRHLCRPTWLGLQDEEEGVQVLRGEALEELLRHLKLKWQSLNEAYVRLPCVTDTPSKKRRKEASRGGSQWRWGQQGLGGQREEVARRGGSRCMLAHAALHAGLLVSWRPWQLHLAHSMHLLCHC